MSKIALIFTSCGLIPCWIMINPRYPTSSFAQIYLSELICIIFLSILVSTSSTCYRLFSDDTVSITNRSSMYTITYSIYWNNRPILIWKIFGCASESHEKELIFSLAPWQGDGVMFREAVIQLYTVKPNYEVDVGGKSELVSRGHWLSNIWDWVRFSLDPLVEVVEMRNVTYRVVLILNSKCGWSPHWLLYLL